MSLGMVANWRMLYPGWRISSMICVSKEIRHCHPLHWRHHDHDGVSNHQPHACLLNCLFRRRSKKISKLRVTGLCVGIHRDRWIPHTKGQLRGKCFYLMTSSCWKEYGDHRNRNTRKTNLKSLPGVVKYTVVTYSAIVHNNYIIYST